MRVGRINLSGMPPEIAERFFGYVFLDTELEEAIADQENTTHYGFSTQLRSPYRNVKQLAQSEFDNFLEELGLKKPEIGAITIDRQFRIHTEHDALLKPPQKSACAAGLAPEFGNASA